MSIDRRILLADDDLEFRSGVAELLWPLGLEIVEAERGDEALSILRSSRLDLAILDMHMPGYSGLDVLRAVRDETLGVPCIFWSGDATVELERRALEAGARAVLRKPIAPAVLREEVRRLLGFDGDPLAQ